MNNQTVVTVATASSSASSMEHSEQWQQEGPQQQIKISKSSALPIWQEVSTLVTLQHIEQ